MNNSTTMNGQLVQWIQYYQCIEYGLSCVSMHQAHGRSTELLKLVVDNTRELIWSHPRKMKCNTAVSRSTETHKQPDWLHTVPSSQYLCCHGNKISTILMLVYFYVCSQYLCCHGNKNSAILMLVYFYVCSQYLCCHGNKNSAILMLVYIYVLIFPSSAPQQYMWPLSEKYIKIIYIIWVRLD